MYIYMACGRSRSELSRRVEIKSDVFSTLFLPFLHGVHRRPADMELQFNRTYSMNTTKVATIICNIICCATIKTVEICHGYKYDMVVRLLHVQF